MLQLFAAPFSAAMLSLERAKATLATEPHHTVATAYAREKLLEFEAECERLPVPINYRERVKRLAEQLGQPPYIDRSVQMRLVHDLAVDFLQELGSSVFVGIPDAQSNLWLRPHSIFGEHVVKKFGGILKDVEGASRCLVMEQWTASVFHSMRIMEHGLRWMADKLAVPFTKPFEFQTWHTIIESIEKAIRKREQAMATGQEKSDELTFYSKAASHFFFTKEAWRNHVAHARTTYDSKDAQRIYDNVKQFMAELVQRA